MFKNLLILLLFPSVVCGVTATATVTISDPCTWAQNAGKCVDGVLYPELTQTDTSDTLFVTPEPTSSEVEVFIDYE